MCFSTDSYRGCYITTKDMARTSPDVIACYVELLESAIISSSLQCMNNTYPAIWPQGFRNHLLNLYFMQIKLLSVSLIRKIFSCIKQINCCLLGNSLR